MKKITHTLAVIAAVAFLASPALANDDMPDGAKVFKKKCKMCHSMDRKKVGPAVMKMTHDADMLKSIVTNGKGRMPKFGKKLSGEEIEAVVAYLRENQAEAEAE